MCLKFTYMGVTGMYSKALWNKDSWHRRSPKTLGSTLTRTSSMLVWPSEIMCACCWWTL